jgi:membrane-associated phospholipid phosphatase
MTVVLTFLLLFVVLWVFFYAFLPLIERLLGRTAHFTAKFRYRDYLPVVIVLGLGIIATSFAGDAFLDLAERLHAESSRMHTIDREVHIWARTAHTDGSTRFFTLLTIIGTPVGLGIVVAFVAALLAARRRWRWAGYLLFTTVVGGLLNLQLKAYFARARPDLHEALRHASGYSFPSGHAMGSTICFGALSYLAFRAIPKWRERTAVIALCVTMIAAIAASRIYLGVHWISDIGAGIAAGAIWFVTTTVAYETFRRIRLIRSLRKKRGQDASSDLTSRGA